MVATPLAVRVIDAQRAFGAVRAVAGVSLDVGQGEFVCLLGPSGCGKTTLLRLIGGFEELDAGVVELLGEDVSRVPPHRRRTNMVFQHLALFPHMNVRDNIAFGLRMRRTSEKEVEARVRAALELVRLTDFGARRVDQLSGGQRQRVAIARAVINEPAVLLLDEPLGALDLRLRIEIQEELRRLQRKLGSPFIFVTHDQGEAMALADRIVVMKDGHIEQDGAPAEIYRRPRTLFVATFVGNSNVVRGTVVGHADGVAGAEPGVVVEALGRRFACIAPAPLAHGQGVAVVIRHEALQVRRADDGAGGVPGVIADSAFLGASARYWIRLADGCELQAEGALEPGPGTAILAPGDAVSLSWPEAAATAFAE